MLTRAESEVVQAAFADALATGPRQLVWEKRLSEILWINSVAVSKDKGSSRIWVASPRTASSDTAADNGWPSSRSVCR